MLLREDAKKYFFSGPATKALPPSKYFWNQFFFELKKKFFFLVARPLPLPPLSGRSTKGKLLIYKRWLKNTINTVRAIEQIFAPKLAN